MKLFLDTEHYIDTSEPLDLSIPLKSSTDNLSAWYVAPPSFTPVRTEHFLGSVKEGGGVNFRNIYFNPHGHGTHTECLGHITPEVYSVNDVVSEYFCKAQLLTITPNQQGSDFIILPEQLQIIDGVEALIIRTLPNNDEKKMRQYSNTNPPYLHVDCVNKILQHGILHLLVDLPSVDRESDNGVLAFHHKFWGVPGNENFNRTITEFIYAPEDIEDGSYILELQIAAFENDASPSRPILYKIKKS